MFKEIKYVDNFFPVYHQRNIIKKFLDGNLVWHYAPYISLPKYATDHFTNWGESFSILDVDAFTCLLDVNDSDNSALIENIRYYTKVKFQTEIKNFLRILIAYLPPRPDYKEGCILTPHIDNHAPHKTLLYYITDNDAPTLFFDAVYQEDSKIDYKKISITEKITPKQGRAVMFNGHIYHAGNVSRTTKRLIMNINFI